MLILAALAPGDTITLTVLRDSSTREIEVTLGELPATDPAWLDRGGA